MDERARFSARLQPRPPFRAFTPRLPGLAPVSYSNLYERHAATELTIKKETMGNEGDVPLKLRLYYTDSVPRWLCIQSQMSEKLNFLSPHVEKMLFCIFVILKIVVIDIKLLLLFFVFSLGQTIRVYFRAKISTI